MKKHGSRVIGLCTVGGAIGFLIGSRGDSLWLGWASAIVCAVFVYIAHAPIQFIRAFRCAWRSTVFQLNASIRGMRGWHVKDMLRMFAWGMLTTVVVCLDIPPLLALESHVTWARYCHALIPLECCTAIVMILVVLGSTLSVRDGDRTTESDSLSVKGFQWAVIHFAPPSLIYYTVRLIFFLLRMLGILIRKTIQFTHSEERILTTSSVVFGMVCGISARAIALRCHYTIAFQYALVCGAFIGLAYGLIGSAVIRRRALIEGASSDLTSV